MQRPRACKPPYTNPTMTLFFSTTGKFLLLDCLLKEIRKRTKDRIVIVSNYTQISYLASPLLSSFPILPSASALCRLRAAP
jgi:hypothetical protein